MATVSAQVEASEVLAAALEQMDGIIAGNSISYSPNHLNNNQTSSKASVGELIQQLRAAVESYRTSDANDNHYPDHLQDLDPDLAKNLLCWLKDATTHQKTNVLGGDIDDWQDKVHQLQLEKDNLMLQVSVLSEQVEAQAEKIHELEIALDDRKEQLDGTEDMLQQEMVSRSQLENSKMDLLGQASDLKKKVSLLEQERIEQSDRCKKLEAEVIITKGRLVEREAELTTLRARLARNGTVTPTIIDQYSEIDKLRQALDSVIATKEEREKKIEELTLQVSRQKRVQDWLPHDRRSSDPSSPEANLNSLYSPSGDSNRSESRLLEKPPPVPRLTSTPVNLPPSYGTGSQGNEHQYSPSPSHSSLQSAYKASSTENVTPSGTRTPPAKRHYSTIPRQHGLQVLQQIQQELQQHKMDSSPVNNGSLPSSPSNIVPPPPSQSQSHHNLTHPSLEVFRSPNLNNGNNTSGRKASSPGVSFGKVFFRLRNGKRSCSAPELAEPEIVPDPLESDSQTLPHDAQLMRLETKDKSKGLKKIFGKLRRSGSHSMDLKEGEFRRGGMRATAGPRLGWNNHKESPAQNSERSFKEWSSEDVCEWLEGIGLGAYLTEGRRWIKGGEQLLKCSTQELERDLGIKNSLHRKKLQLALQAMESASKKDISPDHILQGAGQLDHHWVVRWLDDVGLPQYKDSFVDARVDGRVLHFLTVEDLLSLKVSNSLHHVSIKRGIQVLRQRCFDPHCLKRRSLPDESKEYGPEEVVLWSNHRVMEWLKTVDLSEYAPNLRGSGVHGALIVYEPRFNADLLAALLNIPSSKTLLRRHLSSQFKALVGPSLMQEKRDVEINTSPTQPPLTPNTKVKISHKSQFPLLRRTKGKGETVDYACPLSLTTEQNVFKDIVETKIPEQKSVEEIGAVSKDISSLTSQLKDERLLASMSATNV